MNSSLPSRLAELEGAESALVLASGRAAIACTVLALLRPGDHLVAGQWIRPSTRRFFEQELPALGVQVTFVNPGETRGWRRALTRTTRALFMESPVLETGRVLDMKPPRTVTQELGIALIVDSSAASPVNFTPLSHGADVVVHDASVLLADQGDGEAGVVCGTDGVIEEIRAKMQLWGAEPHPHAVRDLERGLATLEVRVQRQNATAREVAQWAASHRAVQHVVYAGLGGHPDAAFVGEYLRGAGAAVLLDLGSDDAVIAVAARLTGIIPARPADDGSRGWLRLQVGLESPAVLTEALSRALGALSLAE